MDLNKEKPKTDTVGKTKTTQFQEAFDLALADNKMTMQGILEQARKNFEELNKKSGKEADVFREKIEKIHDEFEFKMREFLGNAKEQLEAKYKEYTDRVETLTAAQLIELKNQMTSMVRKYGDPHTAVFDSTLKKVERFRGTATGEVEKLYKEFVQDIDKVHNEALKKLNPPSKPKPK